MPVYSLASRFGFVEQENRYLLVVKVDDIKVALEVNEIDRVIWIEKEAVISLPVVVRATQMCFREVLIYGEIYKKRFSGKDLIGKLSAEEKRGRKESYRLCINTSGKGIKTLIPAVASYAKVWFGED